MSSRPLKFLIKDTTLVSDTNQTLSNLLSQTHKVAAKVEVVSGVANSALARSTNPILALENLSDVLVTGVLIGQTITWNGVDWVNGASQVGPRPAFGSWRGWTANGSDGLTAGYCCSPALVGTGKGVMSSATEPTYLSIATGTIAGAQAVVQSNEGVTGTGGSNVYRQITLGILSCYQTRVQLQATTTERVWIGIGAINGQAGTLNSDTPNSNVNSQNICLFRYSTAAGDTTWKAYCGTTTGNQTIVDTGIVPDTNGHIFQITFDGVSVNFWIDGKVVAQINTTLPATNVRMQDTNYIDNVGTTNNMIFNVAYQYWETK